MDANNEISMQSKKKKTTKRHTLSKLLEGIGTARRPAIDSARRRCGGEPRKANRGGQTCFAMEVLGGLLGPRIAGLDDSPLFPLGTRTPLLLISPCDHGLTVYRYYFPQHPTSEAFVTSASARLCFLETLISPSLVLSLRGFDRKPLPAKDAPHSLPQSLTHFSSQSLHIVASLLWETKQSKAKALP
ncbi:hypothetical protein Pyn_07810 [Prunus yedoensis var. nudiflora]|uniref:Uncharacterized protein n=1 Tax=Prunus yedoensis var. nudiflora TaxID=2094558 RepID=A0A314ZHQ4_PRUYE|nr:hypothetical protein Pyn_07810 [Prunus yedoensis var. nudiflora]